MKFAVHLRHRFSRSALPVALALMLAGCAYALVQDGVVNESKAAEVRTRIQKFRGLDFIRPVPLVAKTRDQAQAMLEAEMRREHSEEDLRIGGMSGAMTGLYPRGMDLKSRTLALMRSQIAGFYAPHDKEMVLVEGAVDRSLWDRAAGMMSHRDVIGEMILAHELTHALQDQHFHIERMLDQAKDNDDRDLALKALAEGDATLAGYGYVMGRLDDQAIAAILARMRDLPRIFAAQSGAVPRGLSAPMMFQYTAGARFVALAYERGGWPAVNALYGHPPDSSLQVMYPDDYYGRRLDPARIEIAGYQEVFAGWRKADDDTYGALLIKTIIQRNLGAKAPEAGIVERWAGDRILVFEKDRALAILWIVAFRDAGSAARYEKIYSSILSRSSGPETPWRVSANGTNVLVAIGAPAESFDRLAPAVWRASTVVIPPPQPGIAPVAPALQALASPAEANAQTAPPIANPPPGVSAAPPTRPHERIIR